MNPDQRALTTPVQKATPAGCSPGLRHKYVTTPRQAAADDLRLPVPTTPPLLASTSAATVFRSPQRVLFCGPIGELGRPAGGGYEAANRRTCDALRRRGVTVIELPYPKPEPGEPHPAWRKLSAYASCFAAQAVFITLRRGDYDLLHLTPLNMHFAWAEAALVSLARLVGKPVLFDVRAGTFERHYAASGPLYRAAVDWSLRTASRVAVEGKSYMKFVHERTGHAAFYFPNYVQEIAASPTEKRTAPSSGGPLQLLYFGRLVPAKGIETALKTLALLRERRVQAELHLIGDGEPQVIEAWKARHAALPVHWHGSLPFDAIVAQAARAHFFIFPSRHDGEGHSNALNEAMALGLVPVCSEQGFSGQVVGDAGAVLPVGAGPERYAQAIDAILQRGQWTAMSRRARERVRRHYSEEVNLPALMQAYRRLFDPLST